MNSADRYLEKKKLDELAEHLQETGYIVQPESEGFDLVARKGDDTIAYMVKVRSNLKNYEEQAAAIRQTAKQRGYDFRLVLVAPPHRVDIEVEDFEIALCTHMAENLPDALDALSNGTMIDEVADIEFDKIEIAPDRIHVEGTGTVSVELVYGKEDGDSFGDSYPFGFVADLDGELHIERAEIDIDVSSFYDD